MIFYNFENGSVTEYTRYRPITRKMDMCEYETPLLEARLLGEDND